MEITTIIMFSLQALLTIVMAFGMFILSGIKESVNKVDRKIDFAQTKENCTNFHHGHKEIHELEQSNIDRRIVKMEQDINNVGQIIRKTTKL